MIRQIEITNPMNGEKSVVDIQCSDTLTHPNGNPIPVSPDENWSVVFEKITPTSSLFTLLP
jgi:hypothetical protein